MPTSEIGTGMAAGRGMLSYEASGVDIGAADAVKKQFDKIVSSGSVPHCSPANRVGAFASLVDIDLSRWPRPLFVLKTEEPGSKQALSVEHGKLDWLAQDLINHLVNDIAVMGATPCAALDTIICGKLDSGTVYALVHGMSEACRANSCVLVGGETSEQPGVLPAGRYVLQASALGVVDKEGVIDGSAVREGDAVVALASNGLHTNGYSLVRRLIQERPQILDERVGASPCASPYASASASPCAGAGASASASAWAGMREPAGESFMDALLKPHTAYYPAIARMLARLGSAVHGMAHITGGGIRDNLIRVIQDGSLAAKIDCAALRVPAIFSAIRRHAGIDDAEMLRTFNCGAGLAVVVAARAAGAAVEESRACGIDAWQIGSIEKSASGRAVDFIGALSQQA